MPAAPHSPTSSTNRVTLNGQDAQFVREDPFQEAAAALLAARPITGYLDYQNISTLQNATVRYFKNVTDPMVTQNINHLLRTGSESIQAIKFENCTLPSPLMLGNFPKLVLLTLDDCDVRDLVQLDHLHQLQSLVLTNNPNLISLPPPPEGLELLNVAGSGFANNPQRPVFATPAQTQGLHIHL